VSAGAAEDAVVRQAREGWDFIKVYRALKKDVYDAIVRTARSEGIGVIGHVPFSARLEDALAGMVSIEHLNSWDRALGGQAGFPGWLAADTARAHAYAEVAAARAVWNCPTMIVVSTLAQQNLSPGEQQEVLAARQAVVRALHRAGAPLLAGTDAGIGITAPGSSLPQELEHLVAAGLTPYEALRAATADAARFLGVEDQIGTIRPGMRADLVLVRGNPLAFIGSVGSVVGVVLRGEWIEAGAGGGVDPGDDGIEGPDGG
jgi:imidazolonepropionase-like amidohydrolase